MPSEKVRQRVIKRLVNAADRYYCVVRSEKLRDRRRHKMEKAIANARRATPPISDKEIQGILDTSLGMGIRAHLVVALRRTNRA